MMAAALTPEIDDQVAREAIAIYAGIEQRPAPTVVKGMALAAMVEGMATGLAGVIQEAPHPELLLQQSFMASALLRSLAALGIECLPNGDRPDPRRLGPRGAVGRYADEGGAALEAQLDLLFLGQRPYTAIYALTIAMGKLALVLHEDGTDDEAAYLVTAIAGNALNWMKRHARERDQLRRLHEAAAAGEARAAQ